MNTADFYMQTGLSVGPGYRIGAGALSDHLPCFAHRWRVTNRVNTPELIDAYIALASKADHNDVLVFSVTEQDLCWNVWKQYAEDHPRKFKVIEGGSIHGKYMCRMYIYTKPAKERKFHEDNIAGFYPQ